MHNLQAFIFIDLIILKDEKIEILYIIIIILYKINTYQTK